MKKSPLTTPFLFLTVVFFVTSCGGKSTNKRERNIPENREEENREEMTITNDINRLLKSMPHPSLVPYNIQAIHADFDKKLINELNIEKYKNNRDKAALNIGIYASDISYLAAYGYEQECMNYLQGMHQLAESLGEYSILSKESIIDNFKRYVDHKEDMSKLLNSMILEVSLKKGEDHPLAMAGLSLAGSFIEGLYHAVVTIETFPEKEENNKLLEPLVKIVLDEEKALSDILKLLKDLPFDDTIADITTELSILDRLYKGDLKEIEEKIKNDPDFVLTKDSMKDITLKIKRVRESIVE